MPEALAPRFRGVLLDLGVTPLDFGAEPLDLDEAALDFEGVSLDTGLDLEVVSPDLGVIEPLDSVSPGCNSVLNWQF